MSNNPKQPWSEWSDKNSEAIEALDGGRCAVMYGSDLLFPLVEIASKSPRLQWMESHGIKTLHRDDLPSEAGRWEAYVGDYEAAVTRTLNGSEARFYPDKSPFLAWGETEEEAVENLAANNDWPLWQNVSAQTRGIFRC